MPLMLSSKQLTEQARVGALAAAAVGEHPMTAPVVTVASMVTVINVLPKFPQPRKVALMFLGVGGAVAFWGAQKNRITPSIGIGVMTGALLSLLAPPKPLPAHVPRRV